MSRARLGLYIFGRASLFASCYELQPTFRCGWRQCSVTDGMRVCKQTPACSHRTLTRGQWSGIPLKVAHQVASI